MLPKSISALASCTTSVYVNLSKNSLTPFGLDFLHDSENQVNLFFSRCSRSSFFASTLFNTSCRKLVALGKPQIHLVLHSLAKFLGESECKGTTNINTNQIFKRKNSQKHESFRESLQTKTYAFILYIRYA